MGEGQRKKKTLEELYKSLMEEINTSIERFRERKGCDPTRLFLGKLEASVIDMYKRKKSAHAKEFDVHGKTVFLEKSQISLPVWVMGAARTMVDVG